MILVSVRDDDAAEAIGMLEYVSVIRKDEVDARVLVIGKHEPGIDENDIATALEGRHVLADGVETAERDDAQRMRGLLSTALIALAAPTRALALWRRFRKRLDRCLRKPLVIRILFFWHERNSSACDHVQVFFVCWFFILRVHRRA